MSLMADYFYPLEYTLRLTFVRAIVAGTDLKSRRNRRPRTATPPTARIPPTVAGLYVRRDHPHFSKPWTEYPEATHYCEVAANIPGYLLTGTTERTWRPSVQRLIRLNTDGSEYKWPDLS